MRYEIETRNGPTSFEIIGDDVICETRSALQRAYDLGRRHQYEWDQEAVQSCLYHNDPPITEGE